MVDGRRVRLWMVPPKGGVWRDADECPPLLLIHGLGCSVEAWKPTLRSLAKMGLNRPVYAVDMPGYGRSQAPEELMGIGDMADWHTRLMDVLGVPRVHVAGSSMGCQVALAMGRRHPERVGGIVLGGATDGADRVPLWRSVLGLFVDAFFEPMRYNATLIRMYLQMGFPRYFATVRKMNEDAPLDCADYMNAPCLIIRGSRDAIIPEESSRLFAAALPQGSFMPVAGGTHAIQFSEPDEFSRLAVAFWGRAESFLFCNEPRSLLAEGRPEGAVSSNGFRRSRGGTGPSAPSLHTRVGRVEKSLGSLAEGVGPQR